MALALWLSHARDRRLDHTFVGRALSFFLSIPVNNLKMAEAENGQAISAGKTDRGGLLD